MRSHSYTNDYPPAANSQPQTAMPGVLFFSLLLSLPGLAWHGQHRGSAWRDVDSHLWPSHNTRLLGVIGGGACLPLATAKPTRANARGLVGAGVSRDR